MARVLFIVSAATTLQRASGTTLETGYWATEVHGPFVALTQAGHALDLATPGALRPRADPGSFGAEPDAAAVREFIEGCPALRVPLALAQIRANYDAIVIPGGYAPMTDLVQDEHVDRLLRDALDRGALIAAICHGPAALLATRRPDAAWPFDGYRMTSFTNQEEAAWLREDPPAWLLADALEQAGADYSHAGVWKSHVVRDRNLLTAQSSASCPDFTRELVRALDRVS